MNPFGESRDIVPIWKLSYEAASSPEITPIKSSSTLEVSELKSDDLLKEFLKDKSLGKAADLLNASILEGREELSKTAAEFIIDIKAKLPALNAISQKVLGISVPDSTDHSITIGSLRERLKETPQNPLAWVDLARAYTVINEKEKSEKAMWAALRYSHEHRWISRMAARLFVHYEELGKAHKVLLMNSNLRSDPWLLSTELAIARLADKPQKNWSQAKKLADSNLAPIHISELTSSLATSEILGGAEKKARSFFKQSLISPTSNSLAQIKWADRSYKLGFSKQIENSLTHVSKAHEAKHWEAYEKKQMHLALEHAQNWLKEEPYSASPSQAITYIASIINDMPLVLSASANGLKANPGDTTLKLNYIFGQLSTLGYNNDVNQEAIEKAFRTLRAVMHGLDKNEAAHSVANIGMFAYRIGRAELGKQYYDEAEIFFEKTKNPSAPFLLINHLRESLIAECSWSSQIEEKIRASIKQPSPTTAAAEYYLLKIDEIRNQPGTWKEKFSHPFSETPSQEPEIKAIEYSTEKLLRKFWLPQDFEAKSEIIKQLKQPQHTKK